MLPATKPAKSSTSQPLVDVFGAAPGGITRSTPWTGAVTSPLPVNETKSPSNAGRDPATNVCGSGAVSSSTGAEPSVNSSTKVNVIQADVVAGSLGPVRDVLHRLAVAVRTDRPVPSVGIGDLLEGKLVLADPLDRHRLAESLALVDRLGRHRCRLNRQRQCDDPHEQCTVHGTRFLRIRPPLRFPRPLISSVSGIGRMIAHSPAPRRPETTPDESDAKRLTASAGRRP